MRLFCRCGQPDPTNFRVAVRGVLRFVGSPGVWRQLGREMIDQGMMSVIRSMLVPIDVSWFRLEVSCRYLGGSQRFQSLIFCKSSSGEEPLVCFIVFHLRRNWSRLKGNYRQIGMSINGGTPKKIDGFPDYGSTDGFLCFPIEHRSFGRWYHCHGHLTFQDRP